MNNGLLLLNKESTLTSFESLNTVKKRFSTGKVGHTGTLDKFASGLLLVLVGRAVKLNFLFVGLQKEYIGTIFFGKQTDTLDPYGAVVEQGDVVSREDLEAVLPLFRGHILQRPPAYSALHIDGHRAYELARAGKEPEMKERPVQVYQLELLSWEPPTAEIYVSCSAGTYIRSLARDIALAAGSCAHLSALKRTGIGSFALADVTDNLLPLDKALFNTLSLPCFSLDEGAGKAFIHGRPLESILGQQIKASGFAAVFRDSGQEGAGELLGVIENRGGKWVYGYVFQEPAGR